MKRLATLLAIAATLAACNNNSQTKTQLKEEAFKEVRDSIQLDSFQRADAKELQILQEKQTLVAAQSVKSASNSSSQRTYVKGVSESYSNTQPQKKGWSKAAKGAAIGGATGAVAGAIISEKKGKGAIIGGILGAGGGYVIGRSKDKREGRY